MPGARLAVSSYYTFKLVVVPQGNGVDALFGKAWPTGTAEPASWTIEEIQGAAGPESRPACPRGRIGWERRLRHGRFPARQRVERKPGVGRHAPALLRGGFHALAVLAGHVDADQRSARAIGHIEQLKQAGDLPDGGDRPASMMITAEVTPSMNLGDPGLGASTVGVGLNTSSAGNGYELAIFKDGSSLSVQLRNGTATGQASTSTPWPPPPDRPCLRHATGGAP